MIKFINNYPRYTISYEAEIFDTQKQQIVKQRDNGNGYQIVTLTDENNISKNCYVHRLVAEAFVPCLPCVNHKDENKKNNSADNLEWCTYSYNNNYGTKIERGVQTRKEKGSYKTPDSAIKIQMLDKTSGKVLKEFDSIKEAGRFLGKTAGHINEAAHGKRKTAYGYKWKIME